MKLIALSNQKGGVGKSSTAVNLAYYLRDKRDAKTLVLDLDPQRNTSKTLGEYGTGVAASSLFGPSPDLDKMGGESQALIELVEADAAMTDIDRHPDPEKIIGHFLSALEAVKDRYDYCVIDTPPVLGLRMTAALVAATHVVTPVEPEEYAIDGIVNMLKAINNVKKKYNQKLSFVGILINRMDRRSMDQKETLRQLQENYAHLLIPEVIGWKSAIPKAISNKQAVWEVKSTAARAASKDVIRVMDYIVDQVDQGAER